MSLYDQKEFKPITKELIDGIKCTRILIGPGSEKVNEYIRDVIRRVLIVSLTREDGYNHDEVGILAKLDGTCEIKPVLGYWSEKHKTSIIDLGSNIEYMNMIMLPDVRSMVMVHNHPCNEVLSGQDIINFLNIDNILITVAICHNGETHYIVKTNDGNKSRMTYRLLAVKIREAILNKGYSDEMIFNKLKNNEAYYGLIIR